MSIEDDPKKPREDDAQATAEWHRARAKQLRKNDFHEGGGTARADRADDRASPAGAAEGEMARGASYPLESTSQLRENPGEGQGLRFICPALPARGIQKFVSVCPTTMQEAEFSARRNKIPVAVRSAKIPVFLPFVDNCEQQTDFHTTMQLNPVL
jgi:hypothetical protein